MNLIIKQLKGGEINLEVQRSTKISEIKEQLSTILHVPVADQKLLLMGRALIDEQTVESYPALKDKTKLNLVVKKPDGLFETAIKFFKANGYTDLEAKNNAVIYVSSVNERLRMLSWDDIERLSMNILLEESGYIRPASDEDHNNSDDGIGL